VFKGKKKQCNELAGYRTADLDIRGEVTIPRKGKGGPGNRIRGREEGDKPKLPRRGGK